MGDFIVLKIRKEQIATKHITDIWLRVWGIRKKRKPKNMILDKSNVWVIQNNEKEKS